ncbi:MAG: phosphoenolpyruvate--protein phosphotransferase [Lachnospiraceae bacterium]|nr:phosphoenolpyruvate--protein phosphotransferase [Lachnospiraceae bacterium]
MQRVEGKSIFGGIAIGKIKFYSREDRQVVRRHVKNVNDEVERLYRAKEEALCQLQKLHEKAVREVGDGPAEIFQVHQKVLNDRDYLGSIIHIIETETINAEYAVACTSDNFSQMFEAMDDEYMRARAADLKDVSNRMIDILYGNPGLEIESDEPVIIVAEELVPSETVQLDQKKVLSFVTRKGSANSHTAILARTMGIPALTDITVSRQWDKNTAIVDGYEGCIYINPDEDTFLKYKEKKNNEIEKRKMLEQLRGKPAVTIDGKEIMLYANIGGVKDVMNALQNDAEGIGLFRSEFLYLERSDYPTEEEQFNVYKTVARNMAGKRVIIRTLDIGADKQADYFGLEHEENPAMGYRAIRICLDRTDLFKTQLRAIYRASAFGKIAVMFPMIISVDEVRRIKIIIEEVKVELKNDMVMYGDVEIGIMIETPAAVMISDLLAKEVDFFSIGTNDLTQYTLAIDRQNSRLDCFYDSHHEAVMRMIKMVADNGHKEGCFVGICGELAADTTLTETFLRMGIDELSVSPSMLLNVKSQIRKVDLSKSCEISN